MNKVLIMCMLLLLMITSGVSAEKIEDDKEIVTEIATENDNEKNIKDDKEILIKDDKKKDIKKNIEVQLEYFNGKIFNNRNMNNYNLHVFQGTREFKVLTIYRGFTITRATGYSRPSGKGWLDSEGVGVGPAFMMRWKQPLSGKLSVTGDFTGSFMFYNKAHPAEGRAYGFLWRLGPRVLWQARENDAIILGYSISHFSNGLKSHNPGYNGLGFTLNFQHQF